jgi:hypothetical protein
VLLVHFKAHVCPKFTHQILAQAQVRGWYFPSLWSTFKLLKTG